MAVLNLQRHHAHSGSLDRFSPSAGAAAKPGKARWSTRYVVTLLSIAASAAFHLRLQAYFPNTIFLPYFPALVLSGVYGGFGPGLLATALGGERLEGVEPIVRRLAQPHERLISFSG